MLISFLTAALAAGSPTTAVDTALACRVAQPTLAKTGLGAAGHPLTQEPPAKMLLAVKRVVGGCDAPAVVRTGIGGSGR